MDKMRTEWGRFGDFGGRGGRDELIKEECPGSCMIGKDWRMC